MIKKGLIEPMKGNAVTEFGHVFEPVMAEKFTKLTGLKTRNAPKTYAQTQFPYALIAGGISFFIYIALGYMFA